MLAISYTSVDAYWKEWTLYICWRRAKLKLHWFEPSCSAVWDLKACRLQPVKWSGCTFGIYQQCSTGTFVHIWLMKTSQGNLFKWCDKQVTKLENIHSSLQMVPLTESHIMIKWLKRPVQKFQTITAGVFGAPHKCICFKLQVKLVTQHTHKLSIFKFNSINCLFMPS